MLKIMNFNTHAALKITIKQYTRQYTQHARNKSKLSIEYYTNKKKKHFYKFSK